MDNISINARSSIRIAGENILYFDPFKVAEEKHDADFVFITHDHTIFRRKILLKYRNKVLF